MSDKPLLYHYWRSSSSWRVRWALAHKRIPFTAIAIDLRAGDQYNDVCKDLSPLGVVPCWVDGCHVLTESVAICEYLEEAYPNTPALFPVDRWERAQLRQWVEIINAGIQPLQNLLVLKEIENVAAGSKDKWAQRFLERGLQALEELARARLNSPTAAEFVVGNTLTLADIFLVPQLYNARRFGVEVSRYPTLCVLEKNTISSEGYRLSCPAMWKPNDVDTLVLFQPYVGQAARYKVLRHFFR